MMHALEQVTVLMTLMRQLGEVMDQERLLLQGMRLEALRDLQSEKGALAEAYEIELRRMRGMTEEIGALDPIPRKELELCMREFQRALSRNAHALLAAKTVVEKLLRNIGESLQSEGAAPGYRPEQRRTAGGKGTVGQVIPVAFNRTI